MSTPPECLPIVEALRALETAYLDAQIDLAEARSPAAKAAAGAKVNALRGKLRERELDLDRCLGCADPATATWEVAGTVTVFSSDPRIPPNIAPLMGSAHNDNSQRGLSFVFRGCEHETILPRSGWEMLFDAFSSFTITVPRRWPDFFTSSPPFITFAPYRLFSTTISGLSVTGGRHERATGHLDLLCDWWVVWSHFGGPASWLRGLYGLPIQRSRFRGLLTTRTIPKTIAPLGSTISGSPLSSASRKFTLVAAGTFSGGFANGSQFELTLPGSLAGQPPLGP